MTSFNLAQTLAEGDVIRLLDPVGTVFTGHVKSVDVRYVSRNKMGRTAIVRCNTGNFQFSLLPNGFSCTGLSIIKERGNL